MFERSSICGSYVLRGEGPVVSIYINISSTTSPETPSRCPESKRISCLLEISYPTGFSQLILEAQFEFVGWHDPAVYQILNATTVHQLSF